MAYPYRCSIYFITVTLHMYRHTSKHICFEQLCLLSVWDCNVPEPGVTMYQYGNLFVSYRPGKGKRFVCFPAAYLRPLSLNSALCYSSSHCKQAKEASHPLRPWYTHKKTRPPLDGAHQVG